MIPKTRLGKWSAGEMAAFFVLLCLMFLELASGLHGAGTLFGTTILAVTAAAMFLIGVLAFVTGSFGILKSHDHSIFVILATAVGFYVVSFIVELVLSQ